MIEQVPGWPLKKDGVPSFHVLQVLSHLPPFWMIRVYIFEVDLKNKAAWFSHLQPRGHSHTQLKNTLATRNQEEQILCTHGCSKATPEDFTRSTASLLNDIAGKPCPGYVPLFHPP